jgi:hypothetical protein
MANPCSAIFGHNQVIDIAGKAKGRFLSVIDFAPDGRRLLESDQARCAGDTFGSPVEVRSGRGECEEWVQN